MKIDMGTLEKIAKAIGRFRYADAIITESAHVSISAKDRAVDFAREGENEGVCIRVFSNGSFGFASSNKIANFQEVILEAEKLSKLGRGNIKIAEPEANKARIRTKILDDPSNHSFEEKIKLLLDFGKEAELKKISSTHLIYSDSNSKMTFLNSSGAEITESEVRTGAAVHVYAKEGGLIESSFEQVKEKAGFEILKAFPQRVEKAALEATSLLSARHGPKGRMIAILDPELAGVFAHEAVGHACEADAIANESSCLRGKLGKRIGSIKVSISDSPIIAKNLWGSYSYDDEGTKAKGTKLIERGILKGYLTSLDSAKQYRSILTGNARGDNSSRPIVRMSNTYFEKGDARKEELFEGVKSAIYLVGCKEGQVSPKIGNFTFAAKYGFVIKNGEKKGMVRDCSINGNILTALHKIDLVANDLQFLPGTCGKDGQSAPVTTGSPHLRIREILVG